MKVIILSLVVFGMSLAQAKTSPGLQETAFQNQEATLATSVEVAQRVFRGLPMGPAESKCFWFSKRSISTNASLLNLIAENCMRRLGEGIDITTAPTTTGDIHSAALDVDASPGLPNVAH